MIEIPLIALVLIPIALCALSFVCGRASVRLCTWLRPHLWKFDRLGLCRCQRQGCGARAIEGLGQVID